MPDAVPARSTGVNDRLVAVIGSVQALTSWTGPDGHVMLASAGNDGTIRRWNAATGAEVGDPLVVTAASGVLATYVDPKGHVTLAAADYSRIRRWDATTGAEIGEPLEGHTREILALTTWVSPDGRIMLASGSDDETIRRWDARTGAEVGDPWKGHTDWIRALTSWVSSDSRVILVSGGDDGKVRRWDATSGALVGSSNLVSRFSSRSDYSVMALTAKVGLDSRPVLVSAGWDGIRRWDATTGAPIGKPLKGHTGRVNALTSWVGPDGHVLLASGGNDGTIRRFDGRTKEVAERQVAKLAWNASRPITSIWCSIMKSSASTILIGSLRKAGRWKPL